MASFLIEALSLLTSAKAIDDEIGDLISRRLSALEQPLPPPPPRLLGGAAGGGGGGGPSSSTQSSGQQQQQRGAEAEVGRPSEVARRIEAVVRSVGANEAKLGVLLGGSLHVAQPRRERSEGADGATEGGGGGVAADGRETARTACATRSKPRRG